MNRIAEAIGAFNGFSWISCMLIVKRIRKCVTLNLRYINKLLLSLCHSRVASQALFLRLPLICCEQMISWVSRIQERRYRVAGQTHCSWFPVGLLPISTHRLGFGEVNVDQLVSWRIQIRFECKNGSFIGDILKENNKKNKKNKSRQ